MFTLSVVSWMSNNALFRINTVSCKPNIVLLNVNREAREVRTAVLEASEILFPILVFDEADVSSGMFSNSHRQVSGSVNGALLFHP